MDLLACRWANPCLMLDEFIRLNQLHDFVEETVKTISEEKIHTKRWDFYLHKVCLVTDMTFEEYVRSCENPPQQDDMSHDEIGNVLEESKKMLEGFTL